jgi:transcriptional regulator with XRE-family HTH domain
MKISEQIKQQRKSHHMSQQELANELNISRQSISKWENGSALPSFTNIMAISELFHISLDELIKNDDKLQSKLEKNDNQVGYRIMLLTSIAVVIAFAIWLYFIAFGSDISKFHNVLQILLIIAIIGLLSSLNWRKASLIFTKLTPVWILIIIVVLILFTFPDSSILEKGYRDGFKSLSMIITVL